MSHVSGLLRVMAHHDADELVLRLGSPPAFTRAGLPVKLFLRPMGPDRHGQVIRELLDEQRRLELAGNGEISFERDDEVGRILVEVKNPHSPRVRLTRLRPAAPEPEVPAAPPPEVAEAPSRGEVPSPRLPPVEAEPVVPPTRPVVLPSPRRGPGQVPAALQALLDHAVERGASDLHLASGEPATLRVDGRLLPLGDAVPDVEGLLAGLLDDEASARLASVGSVDRALSLPAGHRFRLAAYRCDQGVAAAFRVLRRAAPELGSLGLPPVVEELVGYSHGLVLVVGPTGSGKSTTLAALARRALERGQGLLVTLEDPIEYTFPPGAGLVRQREIGRHVPDFAAGLRDALREDPDLLLVGEMRDPESIQLALTAAETGHLVLASLHSRSATGAVERIVDSYPAERQRQIRVQLADALRAVVSQRLVPRRDGAGRIAAVEVLKVNRAAAALIREGKTPQLVSVVQTGAAEGMVTLERSLEELVRSGRVHARAARTVQEDGHS